jgi:hypothetical protein
MPSAAQEAHLEPYPSNRMVSISVVYQAASPKSSSTKRISSVTLGCLPWTFPRLIVRMASIPRSVALADDKDLKPRIGVISFFRAEWSLSIRLFSHSRLM